MGCIFSIFMHKTKERSVSIVSVYSGMLGDTNVQGRFMDKRAAERITGAIHFPRRISREENPEVPVSAFPPGLD